MPIVCPDCRKCISPFKVRRRFSCPFCHSTLTSNLSRILLWAVPAGVAAEAGVIYALSLLVNAKVFNNSLAFMVWLTVVGFTGYVIYWASVNIFAKVTRRLSSGVLHKYASGRLVEKASSLTPRPTGRTDKRRPG